MAPMIHEQVWIEEPSLFGRRVFPSDHHARTWRRRGEQIIALKRSAMRGDRMAGRHAEALTDRMVAELQVIGEWPEEPLQDIYQRIERTFRSPTNWYDGFSASSTTRGTHASFYYDYGQAHTQATTAPTDTRQDILDSLRMFVTDALQQPPAALKQKLAEIKTEMANFDPYLAEPLTFDRTYISMKDPNNPRVLYWQTDGRISQHAVARVLSRYYATPERAALLTSGTGRNGLPLASELIHPDMTHLLHAAAGAYYDLTQWLRDTGNLRVMLWDGSKWLRRSNSSQNMDGFKVINPNGEFEA